MIRFVAYTVRSVMLAAAWGAAAAVHAGCPAAGEWVVPGAGRAAESEVLARAAAARIVLLGESHDSEAHHRWQLDMIRGLSARIGSGRRIILGFEAFPRSVQPALDRWVAGELAEEEFLKAVDWERIWGFDAALYLPLFRFARDAGTPMAALNVARETVRAVSSRGLAAVERDGVAMPAPASAAYVDWLYGIYADHRRPGDILSRGDAAFARFVDVQLMWDVAMAQVLAQAAAREPAALVVGIIGTGHLRHGYGVAHQLAALGQGPVRTMLPWDTGAGCEPVLRSVADAVFGIAPGGASSR